MKKLFLAVMLLLASAYAFAAQQSYTYNYCISNLNDQVNEEPMVVAINIYVDDETRYDMCSVKLVDAYGAIRLNIICRVESGIVRDKIYPTLMMKEMVGGVPTNRKWELRFLGDRARLYCVGGTSYVFKYDPTVVIAAPAPAESEEEAPAEESSEEEEW